jgi:hypothetical protein
MIGPSFDDIRDYWVPNPDEVVYECLRCGMQSDDSFEIASHMTTRHLMMAANPNAKDVAA